MTRTRRDARPRPMRQSTQRARRRRVRRTPKRGRLASPCLPLLRRLAAIVWVHADRAVDTRPKRPPMRRATTRRDKCTVSASLPPTATATAWGGRAATHDSPLPDRQFLATQSIVFWQHISKHPAHVPWAHPTANTGSTLGCQHVRHTCATARLSIARTAGRGLTFGRQP